MKTWERQEARRLRREEGLSLKEICDRLGVSRSSASVWVRDLPLNAEQEAALDQRVNARIAHYTQQRGGHANAHKGRELRRKYQEEGRIKARENDPLHLAGCMLYWAEGKKARNTLCFVNSDADMISLFLRFLRSSMCVEDARLRARILCYLGNGLELREIEAYWIDILEMERSVLSTRVNTPPVSSRQRGRKLLFGVCEVIVHQSSVLQHMYGAIQEYAGIDKPEWLE